ncbi:dihydrodipicolinate synthase family protein [Robertmurraya massiliosenegalensis]|uniref:dihydrodipicolinate synthase family protein n=1 Tax=Robertmurraya massiliosenegalensis TaxID=1287657 RepID=UPI001F490D0B|nr:dihydrodipicolinate synthase family protein [Robertmurraya massiliosenegalensis]
MHRELLPIFEGLFITTNPAPIKYALRVTGIPVGTVRLPLVQVNENERDMINSLLEEFQEYLIKKK